jgi:lysophospholipase L1-like esterase
LSAARRRRWPRRLLGVLLLLVVLELALQAAAPLVQRAMLRRPPTPSPDAPLTILCVGDSNTYGLHVPQWSYPAQLAARLQPRFRGPVEVVNRGVPGQSAAQVAAALPADLRAVRPDLVLVLAGLNDAWNTPADGAGALAFAGRLRLVRLLRVLLSGVTSPGTFEVRSDASGALLVDRGDGGRRINVTEGGGTPAADIALQAAVREGLRHGLEACRDFGAEPVLMTYAENGGTHSNVSAVARELAAAEGVLLIDHERVFGAAFAREGHEALMFNEHHPNARGYALMARTVDEALQAAGRVPPAGAQHAGTEPAGAAPAAPPPSEPELRALGAGRLELRGPAGWAWQLAVARRPDAGQTFRAGAFDVPLPSDDVLARSRLEPSFSGRFGPGERLEVAVPGWLAQDAGGAALSACLVLLNDPGATEPVAAVTPAVDVEF